VALKASYRDGSAALGGDVMLMPVRIMIKMVVLLLICR